MKWLYLNNHSTHASIISEHLSPDDEESNDYQVPITTEPLPREKISNVRQTVMSIHKSFCDYEDSTFADDVSLHRSDQVRRLKSFEIN